MRIARLIEEPDRESLTPAIDAIFFEASATKTFADDAARSAFRWRWLGRYLDGWPELVFIARDRDGTVAGYVAGSPDDPARDAAFADIGYFQVFADACAAYPAQLHINLAPAYRGRGVGGALIDAFGTAARRAGALGIHIVTGADARNAGFYRQQGFAVIAETTWGGGRIVFMGRPS